MRFGKVALEVPESEGWDTIEERDEKGRWEEEADEEEDEGVRMERRRRAEEEGVELPDEGGGEKGPFDGW